MKREKYTVKISSTKIHHRGSAFLLKYQLIMCLNNLIIFLLKIGHYGQYQLFIIKYRETSTPDPAAGEVELNIPYCNAVGTGKRLPAAISCAKVLKKSMRVSILVKKQRYHHQARHYKKLHAYIYLTSVCVSTGKVYTFATQFGN